MTTPNISDHQQQFVTKMTTWSDAEKKNMVYSEQYITSGDPAKLQILAERIKDLPPSTLLKFSEQSPIFKSFCEMDLIHTQEWGAKLKSLGCIGETLPSINNQERCTTFNQYLGFYLYKLYEKFAETEIDTANYFLDESCRFNFLHGLIKRCELNQAIIKADPTQPVGPLLEKDFRMLGNLYWGLGFLRSSRVCMDIGNHYMNQHKPELQRLTTKFHELAAEFFYSSMFIAQWPASRLITKEIYKIEELIKVFKFETRLDAESFLLASIEKNVAKTFRDQTRETIRNKMVQALRRNREAQAGVAG
jgi:hypothetical protein